MFRFEHTGLSWLFAALPALTLLFLLLLSWKKMLRKRIGGETAVARLLGNYSPRRFGLKFICIALAFACGVLAVMNPRRPGNDGTIKRKGIDLAIALDVSRSMLAADFAPNRLERAKQFIIKLMDQLPGDRIALVIFAGKAYMQMPLTTDHGAAQLFISAAGPDAVPQQGTVISEALQMSARTFNSAEKRFKTVILVSDGEDHDESAIRTAAGLAAQGVMINTVGIGSPEGAVITDPLTGENKKDAAGNTVISKLNEDELRGIAERTNGIYVRLQSSDEAVSRIRAQLSQIDRKAFGDESLMDFRTYYAWFAGAMFLLLLAALLIPDRRPAIKNAIA